MLGKEAVQEPALDVAGDPQSEPSAPGPLTRKALELCRGSVSPEAQDDCDVGLPGAVAAFLGQATCLASEATEPSCRLKCTEDVKVSRDVTARAAAPQGDREEAATGNG